MSKYICLHLRFSMANIKIYKSYFLTVTHTHTHTETDNPIIIGEILQICLTTFMRIWLFIAVRFNDKQLDMGKRCWPTVCSLFAGK